MGFIYKVTNSVNGKVYIGQTMRTIPVRWAEHKRYARQENPEHCKKLYYAMRKYGIDAFTIEEIEECGDDVRSAREKYWIDYYDSYKSGYNSTLGGDGLKTFNTSELIKLWHEGKQRNEIAESLGICCETVSRKLNENGITREDIVVRKREVPINHHMIHQYSIDGEYIQSYDYDYAKRNIFGGKIPENLTGKIVHGYQWRYFKHKRARKLHVEPKKYSDGMHQPKEVHQYTIDGEYIQSFGSIAKARKFLGQKSHASIKQSCEKQNRIGFGYRWSYEKVDKLPPINQRKTSSIKVASIDDNGKIIKIYDSTKEAGKDYNLTAHTVYMVCSGRYEKAANTKFIYYKTA